MRHVLWMAGVMLSVAACTHGTSEEAAPVVATPVAAVPPVAAKPDHESLAFVQAACGGCHAVEANDLSPNPQAPRWVDIANRPELTEDTLASWLRDAHNYPEIMDFDLDGDQVDMIAAYMVTLRSPDYKRAPD